MRVAQEHPEHPTAVADRRRAKPRRGALRDKRGQDRGREILKPRDPDPSEIRLKTRQLMLIAVDRPGPQPPLAAQILKEPGRDAGERDITTLPAAADKAGKHHLQHLLDRTAHLPGDLAPAVTLATTTSDPRGYKPLDMPGQILNPTSTPSSRELAKREHQRNPSQHTPRRIAMLAQPNDVALDLGRDPRRPDPIDRLRPDEVLLQHWQLPLG